MPELTEGHESLKRLPEGLYSLKRPALLQLCKSFGVKAVGKNADLVSKLRQRCDDDEQQEEECEGETSVSSRQIDALMDQEEEKEASIRGDDEEDEQQQEEPSQALQVADIASTHPAVDDISMPGAYFATPTRPVVKRARSPSPHAEPEAVSPQQQQQQQQQRIPESPLPFATPRVRRSIAPLPRKSMAVTTSSHGLYPALPPPTPQFRPKEASVFLSPVKPGQPSPRKATMPVFTFSCPAPQTFAPQPSVATAEAGPSTASNTAAKTLLLDRLNERLAATGTTAVSSFEPTIKTSQSSPSRLWAASSRQDTQTEKRFKALHQKELARGGSIANHWSMGRRAPAKAEEAESNGTTAAPHKRAKLSPPAASATQPQIAEASQRPPAQRPPPPATQSRRLPSAVAAAVAGAAGPKRKARSSLHAIAKLGRRKSQLAGAGISAPRKGVEVRQSAAPPLPSTGTSSSSSAPTVRRFFTSGPAAAAVAAAAAKARPAVPTRVASSAALQSAHAKANTSLIAPRAGEASRPKDKLPSSSSLSSLTKRPVTAAQPPPPTSRPASQHAKLSQQQAARRVLDARRRAAEESRMRAREERLAREKGALAAASTAARHASLASLPSAPQHLLLSPSRSIPSTAAAAAALRA